MEFFSLPWPYQSVFPFVPAQMSAEQNSLGVSAMGDGEKTCSCCQFYGVPCRQARAIEDEATIRRNQRLFSSTKRKRSHQEQLAEDSLFLDSPSVDELQTIQKRKNPKCSRDTQVENQALRDYVDGLTITMNVIQPRGRKGVQKASRSNNARCDDKFTGRSTK